MDGSTAEGLPQRFPIRRCLRRDPRRQGEKSSDRFKKRLSAAASNGLERCFKKTPPKWRPE
jgi:hypothetical protein